MEIPADTSLDRTPIELRHLRYFVALAEHPHFGRAAQALRGSQPTLSRHIRDLEYYLGVSLFNRARRGVALTETGKVLFGSSRRIPDEVSGSIQLVRRARPKRTQDIAVLSPDQSVGRAI